jgi:uncharacterized protein (DUF1778 family)
MNDMDMADRRWFTLPPEAWEDFTDALEAPSAVKPKLADLMRREPVWADDNT